MNPTVLYTIPRLFEHRTTGKSTLLWESSPKSDFRFSSKARRSTEFWLLKGNIVTNKTKKLRPEPVSFLIETKYACESVFSELCVYLKLCCGVLIIKYISTSEGECYFV